MKRFSWKRKAALGALVIAAVLAVREHGTGGSGGANVANAFSSRNECYSLEVESPLADEVSTQDQTWCYRTEASGNRIVYQVAPSGEIRSETAIVIGADGMVRHLSLNQGKTTVHARNASDGWNPLGIPLDPETIDRARRVPEPIGVSSAAGTQAVVRILRLVGGRASNEQDDLAHRDIITEGEFSAKAEYLPWRSFWFPQGSGRLRNGADSPMAKYDRFVEKRLGSSPGAQALEKRYHPPRDIKWAGHCNGWAASSIMRAEPTAAVTDPFSGVTFSIADQKGLWVEADYCPAYVFFGSRNGGEGKDGDIRAVDFHNVITYYIGGLKKPVIMDLMNNAPVENRVVSGYDMKITKARTGVYKVTAVLSIHSYDNRMSEDVGPAGIFTRKYEYLLDVDEEGRTRTGKWLSRHPDFFWVPLAPGECKEKNPVVNDSWVDEIYRLSQRPADKALLPAFGAMPTVAEPFRDARAPGAFIADPAATPVPADRQPDEEN